MDIRLHPALTGFPIACIALSMLFEALILAGHHVNLTARRAVLYSAGLAALLAFLSGLLESSNLGDLSPAVSQAISIHFESARILLVSLVPTIVFFEIAQLATPTRQRAARYVFWALLVIAFALAAITSHWGGDLVFEHGVRVMEVR